MNKQGIIIIIFCIIGVISTFLPWLKAPIIGTVNGTTGDGWITFTLFIATIVFCLLDDKNKSPNGILLYATIASPLIAAMIGAYNLFDVQSAIDDLEDNFFADLIGVKITIKYGLFVLVGSGLAASITAIIFKTKTTKES